MKTELEKMLAGEDYFAGDATLTAMRNRARALFTRYNQTLNEDITERTQLLDELVPVRGVNIDIQPPFYCDYGSNIKMGDNVFINYNCTILDCAEILIGNNVFIAPGVSLYAAKHPIIASERIKNLESAAPIAIGDNVWIGGSVTICPGISIGENTTIGAGSVVTKNIPPNCVAAGNPCKVLRKIGD